MHSKIELWDDCPAVRLSSKILTQAHLDISNPVGITASPGKILIESTENPAGKVKLPFSEKQLLAGLDAYTSHRDELAVLLDGGGG